MGPVASDTKSIGEMSDEDTFSIFDSTTNEHCAHDAPHISSTDTIYGALFRRQWVQRALRAVRLLEVTLHALQVWFLPMFFGFPEEVLSPAGFAMPILIDIGLMLISVVNIVRPYTDEHGFLVLNFDKVRKHNLNNSVIIGFLCLLPIDSLMTGLSGCVAQHHAGLLLADYCDTIITLRFILRLPRLFFFPTFVRLVGQMFVFKRHGLNRLVHSLLFIPTLAHYGGCIFYGLTRYPNVNTWATRNNLDDSEFYTKYLATLYTSMRVIFAMPRDATIVDQHPVLLCFLMVELLTSVSAVGFIFGSLASVVRSLDPETLAIEKTQEEADWHERNFSRFLTRHNVPGLLQDRLRSMQSRSWELGVQKNANYLNLPPSLRRETLLAVFGPILRKMPMFANASRSCLGQISECMRLITYKKGAFIVRAGEVAEEVFFLTRGEVAIYSVEGAHITTLKEGAFFGEVALFERTNRTAHCKAVKRTEIAILTREDFAALLNANPDFSKMVMNTVEEAKFNDFKRNSIMSRGGGDSMMSRGTDVRNPSLARRGTRIRPRSVVMDP